MAEREWEQKIEDAAARWESRIEAAADRLERGITNRYNRHSLFYFLAKAVPILGGTGLLASGKCLWAHGHKPAAGCCLSIGLAGLLAQLLLNVLCRREP